MAEKKKTEVEQIENGEEELVAIENSVPVDRGYYTAEELREKLNTPCAEFEGTKAMNGWKQGRQLTEADYIKAVAQFNNATAGGR